MRDSYRLGFLLISPCVVLLQVGSSLPLTCSASPAPRCAASSCVSQTCNTRDRHAAATVAAASFLYKQTCSTRVYPVCVNMSTTT